ncbi:hypothetical protein IAD21_06293 [Abditibacteriota bacterium]|nr:hypothetical protein IAD21_06293 [Abditibacteriota bacterium]
MSSLSFLPSVFFSSSADDVALDEIRALGTPGEMVSLSFFLASSQFLAEIEIEISDLSQDSAVIHRGLLDLYVVKVWEQAGIGVYQSTTMDVAELLLKDDRECLHDHYSRRCAHWKNPRHWRHGLRPPQFYCGPTIRLHGPVRTSLEAGAKKQLWVSVKIPPEAGAGIYTGYITFKTKEEGEKRFSVLLEVLPIQLLQPPHDFFMWYKGTLDCVLSQHHVSERVFEAQLRDIYEHGFTSFSLAESKAHFLQKALDIAHRIGFCGNVVLTGGWRLGIESVDFKGMTPIYYVSDEADLRGESAMRSHADNWRKVKAHGGTTMASILNESNVKTVFRTGKENLTPDILLFHLVGNRHYFAMRSQFASAQEKTVYYYWLSHIEKPNVHRVLMGLLLWKSGAQGVAPYSYQHLPGRGSSPFDDFAPVEDEGHSKGKKGLRRSLMTTYPAAKGSIPTLQWKGLSAGITDLKYLTTLNATLEAATSRADPDLQNLAFEIQRRVDNFLNRLSWSRIEIPGPVQSEPYLDIAPWEYQMFREQMARDIVSLQNAMDTL